MRTAIALALALAGCTQPLGAGPECEGPGCEPDPTCTSPCRVGATECVDGAAARTCELVEGCGRWGVPVDCPGGCDRASDRCRPKAESCAGTRLEQKGGLDFGGLCTRDCARTGRCDPGTRCVDVEPGRSYCLPSCTPSTNAGCRDGWVCEDQLGGFCLPPCTDEACALFGHACDADSGRCVQCGRPGEACCPGRTGGAATCEAGVCELGRCG